MYDKDSMSSLRDGAVKMSSMSFPRQMTNGRSEGHSQWWRWQLRLIYSDVPTEYGVPLSGKCSSVTGSLYGRHIPKSIRRTRPSPSRPSMKFDGLTSQ